MPDDALVYRNARHVGDGRIDIEIARPNGAWRPFTADPADPEEHGRAIHAVILADAAAGLITILPAEES